ncbi:MAG: hypothetical protein JNL70_02575 [Saprospiraceae bacterium]|nr:hypothetical protein [Saprospiraceae bacterium]
MRFSVIMAVVSIIATQRITAQTDVKIGNNPGNKTASAVLELESTTKGFLLPRMTAAQMNAISSPANGLAVYNTDQQCTFIYRGTAWASLCDSATNGLTKSGSVISLGGALTGATTITTTGTNTLAVSGLQGGAATDSIMTLDATTGVLKRRTVADVLTGSGNVWLIGGNTLTGTGTIGSNSNHDFGIETNGTTRLTFSNAGAITQSGTGQVTFTGNVDATNGLDVTTGQLTANAGSTLTGVTNINATGSSGTNIGNASTTTTVLGATNINTTGTSATSIGNASSSVAVAGTTSVTGATTINTTGTAGTTIGNASSTTAITGATNINTTGAATTTIGNSGAAAVIAGSTVGVTGVTNINTTGTATTNIGNATSTVNIVGNDLNVTGLQSGASTDSIMTVTGAGDVRRRTVADVVGGSITADNGLTKNTATNVQLGGTLLQTTSIAQAGFDFKLSGGNVAIGSSTAPTSTMQLTGSMGVSYRKVTGNTTLAATDYVVLANATSGAITLTLPTASTCVGRIYYIGKSDEGTNAVNFSPAIYLTETTTIASINFAKKYKIVSDGTNWWIYSE